MWGEGQMVRYGIVRGWGVGIFVIDLANEG